MFAENKTRWILPAAFGVSLVLVLAGGVSHHPMAPALTALGVIITALTAWLVAISAGGSEGSAYSRTSMFRSQWQVPLYAGVAVFITTILGSVLKSGRVPFACSTWPLCEEVLVGEITPVVAGHLAHRLSAGLAGILLIYTAAFVFRRHRHRPALLGLTGGALVLYTTQVLLGASAAAGLLTSVGAFSHLMIAAALTALLFTLAAVGYYAPSVPSIAGASVAVPLIAPIPIGERLRAYLDATKPRILVLLLITGYAAMWVANGGAPPFGLALITMVGLAMSCGAANAINMWYDTDIDSIMNRTQKRPIPSGRLSPEQVLSFGVITGVLSFILLAFSVNLLTAWLSLGGLLFYVFIYTMWLKRSSVQNIVIGGAAGAAPPLVGWAAVTGELSWAAVAMFMIIFVWTPPHFWALALFRNDDYRRANIPMMPVVKGEMHTKWQVLGYALLLLPTVASLHWAGAAGTVYLWSSLIMTLVYLGSTVMLFFERLPEKKWAVRSFIWSIFWLGAIFLVACADAVRA